MVVERLFSRVPEKDAVFSNWGTSWWKMKDELLEKMEPLCYGGGMNNYFEEDNSYELKDIPTRFEAGTPPIAEVIGLGEAIEYLMNIGMDKIREHEKKLKEYYHYKQKF